MSRRKVNRGTDTIAHLAPDTIAVLLDGWHTPAPVPSPHGFGGGYLELGEPQDAGILRLWSAHREALLERAAEWGWEPSWEFEDGTRVFYGDYVTAAHSGDEA